MASPAIGVNLTAPVVNGTATTYQPVAGQSVSFLLTPTNPAIPTATVVVNTDAAGNATLSTSGLPAGTYSIVASFLPASAAGSGTNYAGAMLALPTPFVMNGQTLTFAPPSSLTYSPPGTFPITANVATPNGGQPITITSTTPAVCTVAGTPAANVASYTATIVAAGDVSTPALCKLTAQVAGSSAFATAQTSATIAITKAAQTVTFTAPAPLTYLQSTSLPASTNAAASQPITYTVTGPCSVAGNVVTATSGTGTCAIAAAAPGTSLYSAYSNSSFASIPLQQASQSIVFPTVAPPPTFVAGGAGTFQVSATGGASGNPVTFSVPTTTSVCSVTGTAVRMLSAGMCTIVAKQAGNANFGPATTTQTVTIAKAAQTISFANPGNKTFGTPPMALVATASSGLPVVFGAAGSCTVAGTTLTLTSTGNCTVTAKQAGDTNFAPAVDVPQSILIDLANLWTPIAARMTTPRSHHTANRFETGPLAGWVLVAGGVDANGNPLASAELYNPATRTFVATGKLHGKSSDHTATLLQDGRVIVTGGGNGSSDVYDPATQTWSVIGGSGSNRSLHTATRLPDGRVLIVGGADNGGKTLKTTIVFNPASGGSFANGPTLDTARERHTATLLTSGPNAGKVLIVGGRYSSGNNYVANATYQLCDATACTASQGGIVARFKHGAAALVAQNGTQTKVLVAGGTDGSSNLATAEIYDVAAGSWSNAGLGTLTPARKVLTLSALPNGRALAAGGRGKPTSNANAVPLTAADVFAPPFGAAAPMGVSRSWHTATPLTDASGNVVGVLIIGGKTASSASSDDDDDGFPSVDSAEIYGMH